MMFSSAHFISDIRSTSSTMYIPPWCIRFIKHAIIFVVIFVVLVLYIAIITSAGPPKRRTPKEPFERTIERLSVCEKLSENDTRNASVMEICNKLNSAYAEFYRLRDEKVNPFNHNFIIPAPDICDDDTEAVMLIHSLHTYSSKRHAIRTTWAKATLTNSWPTGKIGMKIAIAFVHGIHRNKTQENLLLLESKKHKDIIQGDFYESYRNMTLKSLTGIKWVMKYCPSAKYLIKSDDDMIINMPALMKVFEKHNLTGSIMGPLNRGSRVYRAGKWGLKKTEFPFYFFPPYESGSAYVISTDLLPALFNAAERVPHIFIDDVFITGILGKILNVRHIEQPGFASWIHPKPKPCDIKTNAILSGHKMDPNYMLEFWGNLSNHSNCDNTSKEPVI